MPLFFSQIILNLPKILNKNTMQGKKIESLEAFLHEIATVSEALKGVSDDNIKVWTEGKKQIERAVNQFYGEKHFIIVTGMLKAGKSTLIDLLARTRKASLVGFGVDTTLRPAVIKMSETEPEGCIKVYYKPDGMDEKSAMQQLTDSLRGLKEFSKIPIKYELNDNYLRKILCSKVEESDNCLNAEPLLVIVEVPQNNESRFFANDCILLDMPGLDSTNSVQSRDNEKYKAFFDECDLLLFVQSSVAPINKEAGKYLKYIGLTRDESTYSLVQNVMNVKYWQHESVTDKEQQNQTRDGIKAFKQCLDKDNAEIKPYRVNLGMAYDAILGSDDDLKTNKSELLKDSHFTEMEDNLITDIANNGGFRHLAHCADVLRNTLSNTITDTEKQIEDIKSRLSELSDDEKSLKRKISKIKRAYENYQFRPMQFAVSENLIKEIKENLFKEFDYIKSSEKYSGKITIQPEDDNTKIKAKATYLTEFMNECGVFAKRYIRDSFKEAYLDNLVNKNDVSKNAIQLAQEELKVVSEGLKDDDITLNTDMISANANNIGELDSTFAFADFDGGRFEPQRPWYLFGFQKRIEYNLNRIYDKIFQHYTAELSKLIGNNNVTKIITTLLKSVIQDDLQPQLVECEKSLSQMQGVIETLSRDESLLKDAMVTLKSMKSPDAESIKTINN